MGKTIVVVGFGPGISTAVAEKFGSSGFSVALVGRNEERLASGVKALKTKGIDAAAFPADAGDPAAMRAGDGAVLISNGAFGDNTPQMDELAVTTKGMGLALANAAKHKLVGLLAQRLKPEGVYVGEVVVAGNIKGSAWDRGTAAIDGSTVANKLWELYQARGEFHARVG
jgi:NAD(P)-dependent dehydrogenase (short-subunit alcohol dehydrogenase family)